MVDREMPSPCVGTCTGIGLSIVIHDEDEQQLVRLLWAYLSRLFKQQKRQKLHPFSTGLVKIHSSASALYTRSICSSVPIEIRIQSASPVDV